MGTRVDSEATIACQQLLARHAEAQDSGSADKLRALFTRDGRWIRPGKAPIVGRDAIFAHAEAMFRAPIYSGRLVHMITNMLFADEDGGLRSTSYCIAYGAESPGPDGVADMGSPLSVVRYRNSFRRENDEWRISLHQTEFLFKSGALA